MCIRWRHRPGLGYRGRLLTEELGFGINLLVHLPRFTDEVATLHIAGQALANEDQDGLKEQAVSDNGFAVESLMRREFLGLGI